MASDPRGMAKIRVLQVCNQLGIGGTEKTIQVFSKYLDRSRFEVFVCGLRAGGPGWRRSNGSE